METADVISRVNKIDKNFKTLLFLLKVIHISNSVLLLFLTGIQCKLLFNKDFISASAVDLTVCGRQLFILPMFCSLYRINFCKRTPNWS